MCVLALLSPAGPRACTEMDTAPLPNPNHKRHFNLKSHKENEGSQFFTGSSCEWAKSLSNLALYRNYY